MEHWMNAMRVVVEMKQDQGIRNTLANALQMEPTMSSASAVTNGEHFVMIYKTFSPTSNRLSTITSAKQRPVLWVTFLTQVLGFARSVLQGGGHQISLTAPNA